MSFVSDLFNKAKTQANQTLSSLNTSAIDNAVSNIRDQVNSTISSIDTDAISASVNNLKDQAQQFASGIDWDSVLDVLKDGGIGAIIGLCLIPCLLLVLLLLGFTCTGIALGSMAAFSQSRMGNVADNSCFSCFQSIAMSHGTYKLIPILGVIGFVGGIIYHFL